MHSSLPDMGKVGEAAAKLPDPQAVMFYFLLVLIVVLVLKDIVGAWRHARVADRHAGTADRFAEAANKLSDTMQASDGQIAVQLALIQREMSDAKAERARILAYLERQEQRP